MPLNKMRTLIDLAKLDLYARINENDSTTWYSAINNVETALSSGVKAKDKLVSLLADLIDGHEEDEVSATNHSAVLAPILFEDISNLVVFSDILAKAKTVVDAGLFNQCIILAVQKSTVAKLEKFLLEEAGE